MPSDDQPRPAVPPAPNRSEQAKSLVSQAPVPRQITSKGGVDFRRAHLEGFPAGADLSHSQFTDTGCVQQHIDRVDFRYAVFERAYFRKVRFTNCRFTGSRFKESAFPGCVFEACDFSYATFQETSVHWEQLQHTLPPSPNLRRDLLQNLRANAASIGDYEGQTKFIDMEIKAQREYYRRAIAREEQYYKEKYDTLGKRFGVRIRSLKHRVSYLLWGNGEHVSRLFLSTCIFILILPFAHVLHATSGESTVEDLATRYLSTLEETFLLFMDAPDRGKQFGEVYTVVVLLARYAVLGLAISALFRRLSVR